MIRFRSAHAALVLLGTVLLAPAGAQAEEASTLFGSGELDPRIDFDLGEIRVLDSVSYDRDAALEARFAGWSEGARTPGAAFDLADDIDMGGEGSPGYAKPVLLSALVPGAGELSLGSYGRALIFFAAEAFGWYGYFSNRSDGLDGRDRYEAFADLHWTIDTWFWNRDGTTPGELGLTTSTLVDDAIREKCFQWRSKEEDRQEYYENIGKYNCYSFGWDDFSGDQASSPNRAEYRAMRASSNDDLNQARNFLAFNIATRLVSMIDSALIVRSRRRAAEEAAIEGGEARATRRLEPWCKYKLKGPMVGFTLYFQ